MDFFIYIGLSCVSIVQKLVVAICGKMNNGKCEQWKVWTSRKNFMSMFWKANEICEDRVAVGEEEATVYQNIGMNTIMIARWTWSKFKFGDSYLVL